MNVLVVDELNTRRDKLMHAVEEKKHKAIACSLSNEFIDAIQEGKADKILLDCNTWREGRSIYGYLRFAGKLEKTPILFYNAPEGFTTLNDREPLEQDRVFPATMDVENLINSVQQEL